MRSILVVLLGLLLLSTNAPADVPGQQSRAMRHADRHGVTIPTWPNPGSANLYQKHGDFGLGCITCHDERPPAKTVGQAICLSCHGSYDDLADKSDEFGAHNPHASHEGPLECGTCHGVHKASVDHCAECHAFNTDVP